MPQLIRHHPAWTRMTVQSLLSRLRQKKSIYAAPAQKKAPPAPGAFMGRCVAGNTKAARQCCRQRNCLLRIDVRHTLSLSLRRDDFKEQASPSSVLMWSYLIVFTGPDGLGGNFTGGFNRDITSVMPRSNCGSWPSISDFGSLSTSISGSTP